MVLPISSLSWTNSASRNKRSRLASIYPTVPHAADRPTSPKSVSIYFDIWNALEFKIIAYLYLKYLSNLIQLYILICSSNNFIFLLFFFFVKILISLDSFKIFAIVMKVIATWAYFWKLYLADALLIDDYAMNIPSHFMNRMAVITVFQTKTTISLQITFLYFLTKKCSW